MGSDELSHSQLNKLDEIENLCKEKKYEEAIIICNELILEKADFFGAYSKRSSAYFSLHKYKEAFEDLESLMKLRPDSPRPYFTRGYRKLEIGEYENAIKDLTIVIDTREYYFLNAGHFYRSLAYYKLGKKKEALEDCLQLPHDFSLWAKLPNEREWVYTKDSLRELIMKMH